MKGNLKRIIAVTLLLACIIMPAAVSAVHEHIYLLDSEVLENRWDFDSSTHCCRYIDTYKCSCGDSYTKKITMRYSHSYPGPEYSSVYSSHCTVYYKVCVCGHRKTTRIVYH